MDRKKQRLPSCRIGGGEEMMKYYLKLRFDAHVHLRGPNPPWCESAFELIVASVAKQCRYAVVMPNSPIIKTVDEMKAYREQIIAVARKVAPMSDFEPLMTLYLTEDSSEEDIIEASKIPWFAGWKLYPQGVTTGSEDGVSDLRKLKRVLRIIDKYGSRLLIHGETTRRDIGVLHTEEIFVQEDLPVIREMFKGKICLEHCSTLAAVDAVKNDSLMWGSITPHHLTGTVSEVGNPHNRCKPVWQVEEQRRQILEAVLGVWTSGKFFAGTDTAPQLESQKLSDQVPNGCFTSPVALQLYFQAFYEAFPIRSHRELGGTKEVFRNGLNDFLYTNAAIFYNMPISDRNISTSPIEGATIVVTERASRAPSANDFKFFNDNSKRFDRIVPLREKMQLPFSVSY